MCFDTKEDSCAVSFLTFFPGILCCIPCIRTIIYKRKLDEAEEHGIVISDDAVRAMQSEHKRAVLRVHARVLKLGSRRIVHWDVWFE